MAEFFSAEIDRLAQMYSDGSLSEMDVKRLVDAIVHVNKKPIGIGRRPVPEGYLSLREIENSLVCRMWAGIGRTELAEQILRDAKQTNKRTLGFGARRDRVAASLQAAFFAGKLALYVAADEIRFHERCNEVPAWTKEPMPVPQELLGHLFGRDGKGRLPATFAIRASRKLVGNDRLFALLNCGHLVVREIDFRRWVQSERCKRRWPSQNAPSARPERNPVGRPSKLNDELRNAILEIVRAQVWNGNRRPITELHRLLSDQGLHVPSVDTLGRMVDALFAATGKLELRRRHRVRRK